MSRSRSIYYYVIQADLYDIVLFIHHDICRLQPSQFIPNSPDTLSNSIRIYDVLCTNTSRSVLLCQTWEIWERMCMVVKLIAKCLKVCVVHRAMIGHYFTKVGPSNVHLLLVRTAPGQRCIVLRACWGCVLNIRNSDRGGWNIFLPVLGNITHCRSSYCGTSRSSGPS